MKIKWSRSVVSDSLDPLDCSPPGSSVHGILQARALEWGATSFSRASSLTQGLNPGLPRCRQTLSEPPLVQDSCSSIVCECLRYSRISHVAADSPPSWASLLRAPGPQVLAERRAGLSACSSAPLAPWRTPGSGHTSKLLSQFVPPPTPPAVATHPFSLSALLFLPRIWGHQHHPRRFSRLKSLSEAWTLALGHTATKLTLEFGYFWLWNLWSSNSTTWKNGNCWGMDAAVVVFFFSPFTPFQVCQSWIKLD